MRSNFSKALPVSLLLVLTINFSVIGQVSNYNFSQTLSVYEPITNGNIIVVADNSTPADDELYQMNDIGFDFKFNGTNYSSFGISTNGFIWLGAGVPDALTYAPISDPSANLNGAGSIEGVISPLGNDLLKRLDSPLGEIMIRTTGDAPGRVCTIQFSNWSSLSGGSNTTYNFQVKLFETTNQIAFVYSGFSTSVFVNSFEIGLRGFDNTDFKNVVCTSTDWAGVGTGTGNDDKSTVSSTILPADGTTFLWTPGGSPLPLTLSSFTAIRTGSCNELTWSIINQSGIKSFMIERSENAKNYTQIGKINTTLMGANQYTFKDNAPTKGINYYRVKMATDGGKALYSQVKTVRNEGTADVKLYPNPAVSLVNLEILSDKRDKAAISVSDINGKSIYHIDDMTISKGNNKIKLNMNSLAKGVYYVKVLFSSDMYVQRILKQ